MKLELVLQIIGWAFTLIPLLTFLTISVAMFRGVGKDDPLVKNLTLAGLTIFLIGVIMLLTVYVFKFI